MPRELLNILKDKILLCDGAWGTQLQSMGLKSGDCPELWNLIHPEKIFHIAKSYVKAGSDIIETNSFGGSKIKLHEYGLEERCYEINKTAAQISRKAAGDKFVFGSVGPTGKFLMTGEITKESLADSYKEQCLGLIDGGADTILLETFYDLEEACIAIDTVREICELPLAVSFTFQKTSENVYNTIMGNTVKEIYTELVLNKEVDIIGTNCGNGLIDIIPLVSEINKLFPSKTLLVQSNAGVPEVQDGVLIYNESPSLFRDNTNKLIENGVNIIGGCCGTTPEYISEIRQALNIIDEVK
jgi:5-methyltetrahydrofolate--homocysteine methyltransferase